MVSIDVFGLFSGDSDGRNSHDAPVHSERGLLGEVEDELQEFGARDFNVDHLSGRDQPEKLGGGIADASFDHPGSGRTYVEVDSGRGQSQHDRSQMDNVEESLGPSDERIHVTEYGVSFNIEQGETVALIGESGSGESTVAKTIIGLHEAADDTIRFDCEEIAHPNDEQVERIRNNMQMVFQDPTSSLNPRRTIGNSLEVLMQARGVSPAERHERISELLELVELNDEYLYKYPHELSGGQKQRINIVRAISIEPDLLLLDEPTSTLDVSVQAKIIGLLEDLQQELGLTYLFITHDLSLVRNFADETAVMYLGQIQEKGQIEEVFHSPRHPYSRALLSALLVTSDEEEAYKPCREPLEGEIPSPRDVPSGCRFHTRCSYVTEACHTSEPGFKEVPKVRCHIYDETYRDQFDEVPDVTASAVTDGGTSTQTDEPNITDKDSR